MTVEERFKRKLKTSVTPSLKEDWQYPFWFRRPIDLLYGCTPKELARSAVGRKMLTSYLADAGIKI